MLRYTVKRFFASVLTIWILVTAVFFLVRSLPGDPFSEEKVTQAVRVNLEKYYGMDKPIYMQYFVYLGNLLKGDMGYSLHNANQKVNTIISNTFPKSADLGLRSLLIAILVGLPLGVFAALQRGRVVSHISIVVAIIGISVPNFVMGYMLQYFFSYKLKWFPVALWRGFSYTVLPSIALSFATMAILSRLMRTSMLNITNEDYIKTARAKGLSTFAIVWKHQIRNAILPIVTILGPITAAVLTGTFVIENIFAIPGMGRFYVIGINNRDYTITLGLTVFYGSFLVMANFLVDVVYGVIDPRIRVAES
jgi:oligopeptide transport system permease protein